MAITLEAIRAAGGIVHSDGNIFFRDISMLQGLAGAAPAAAAGTVEDHSAVLVAARDLISLRTEYAQKTQNAMPGNEYWGTRFDAKYQALAAALAAAPALEAPAAPVREVLTDGQITDALWRTHLRWMEQCGIDTEGMRPTGTWLEHWLIYARAVERAALAAAPQAPNCTRCRGSGEDPEGYLTHGRGPDDHTMDGPCRSCDGTGAAPQAPAAPAEGLAADVEAVLTLLEEHEWAEHCTKTPLGQRLEAAITELHNEIHAAEDAPYAAAPAVTIDPASFEGLIAAVRSLPTTRATEFDGEESDGTPQRWRNRPFVSRTQLERLLRERVAAPAAPAVDAETVKKAARYDWLRGSNVANGTVLAEHFGGSRMQDFDAVIDAKIAARATQAKEGGA